MIDTAVIGGGAAGLIAAGAAAQNGKNVVLIEKNDILGKKLLITGKGRCNVTNNSDINNLIANVPTNGSFLYSAFSQLSAQDTMDFFENLGVPLKTERGNRVFPVSDRSQDIVSCLEKYCRDSDVQILNGKACKIIKKNDSFEVIYNNYKTLSSKNVIITTGGKSYPKTGSTGDGYSFAEKFGHKIISCKPSLVPIEIAEGCCKNMQGLSLKNTVMSVYNKSGIAVFSQMGEMLFTHFGISGPLVLSASAHMREFSPKEYTISIDLKPALSHEQLDARLLREFKTNKDFVSIIRSFLPAKMVGTFADRCVVPFDIKVHQITKQKRGAICVLLKDFKLTPSNFRPIDEAVITSGGICVDEVNPKTMESKLHKGLYFAGEVLDLDGYTGGYNLQIAWSTGYAAGLNA